MAKAPNASELVAKLDRVRRTAADAEARVEAAKTQLKEQCIALRKLGVEGKTASEIIADADRKVAQLQKQAADADSKLSAALDEAEAALGKPADGEFAQEGTADADTAGFNDEEQL